MKYHWIVGSNISSILTCISSKSSWAVDCGGNHIQNIKLYKCVQCKNFTQVGWFLSFCSSCRYTVIRLDCHTGEKTNLHRGTGSHRLCKKAVSHLVFDWFLLTDCPSYSLLDSFNQIDITWYFTQSCWCLCITKTLSLSWLDIMVGYASWLEAS